MGFTGLDERNKPGPGGDGQYFFDIIKGIEATIVANDTVAEAMALPERDLTDYIQVDGTKATFARVPTLDEVPYPVKMEPNLVVEFYSR